MTPPIGDVDLVPSRRCTRLMGFAADGSERLCDAPAAIHVDWGDALGFICEGHAGELGDRWKADAQHTLKSACGMPGAVWFNYVDGTSGCIFDGDNFPTAEPVRAVAEAVS